jgi:hypothetical protein
METQEQSEVVSCSRVLTASITLFRSDWRGGLTVLATLESMGPGRHLAVIKRKVSNKGWAMK